MDEFFYRLLVELSASDDNEIWFDRLRQLVVKSDLRAPANTNPDWAKYSVISVISSKLLSTMAENQHLQACVLASGQLLRHDDLTGIPNRLSCQEELERAEQLYEQGVQIVVVRIDLVAFSKVNSNLGHNRANGVLKIAAHLICSENIFDEINADLQSAVRRKRQFDDVVFRDGGDEFTIIMKFPQIERSELASKHQEQRSQIEAYLQRVKTLYSDN